MSVLYNDYRKVVRQQITYPNPIKTKKMKRIALIIDVALIILLLATA